MQSLARDLGWVICLLAAGMGMGTAAGQTPPSAGGEASSRVLTRAVVRSLPGPAEPITLRLKVLPRGKLPFTTIAFGLARPELAQGIQVGDEVGFIAERTEAGNTIVRLRKLAPCVRFQPCPVVRDD